VERTESACRYVRSALRLTSWNLHERVKN